MLFHRAARVESIALPEGTEVRAWSCPTDENGSEHDYNVFVETPDAQPVVMRRKLASLPEPAQKSVAHRFSFQ